jgi:hypothetical protein
MATPVFKIVKNITSGYGGGMHSDNFLPTARTTN